MEREVRKMMHYGWSSGEMEWSSGVGEGQGRKVGGLVGWGRWLNGKVGWAGGEGPERVGEGR